MSLATAGCAKSKPPPLLPPVANDAALTTPAAARPACFNKSPLETADDDDSCAERIVVVAVVGDVENVDASRMFPGCIHSTSSGHEVAENRRNVFLRLRRASNIEDQHMVGGSISSRTIRAFFLALDPSAVEENRTV